MPRKTKRERILELALAGVPNSNIAEIVGCHPDYVRVARQRSTYSGAERMRAHSRKWVRENPDKAREAVRRWQAANQGKMREYRKRYYEANKERWRTTYAENRQASKRIAPAPGAGTGAE